MSDIFLGKGEGEVYLKTNMMNRHGLIAGATGTGKTTTLKVIAENASLNGIPVFIPDVKGDLYSISRSGEDNPKIRERLEKLGITDFNFRGLPVASWDILEDYGIPIRASVSEMGPILLSNLLELNDTQTGILNIAFKIADEEGLLLIDFKDLKAILKYISDNAKDLRGKFGNISPQSVGAIMRSLLVLENEGVDKFFGEPSLEIEDILKIAENGEGIINILNARTLFQRPRLYTTFLVWLLSEVYEYLPEVGDLEKPKLIFFFDEAHLIFSYGSKVLKEKLLQVIKLIRSKGVSIFFVTQSPEDIPKETLSQLGNKIQHALRAFTPNDRKTIKETAKNFRENPNLDIEETLTNMESGVALVSTLDEKGLPNITEKTLIAPPRSSFSSFKDSEIKEISKDSNLMKKYFEVYDRESAYEVLEEKALNLEKEREIEEELKRKKKEEIERDREESRIEREKRRNTSSIEKAGGRIINSMMGTIGRKIGNEIVRGIFGNLFKK